MPDATIEPVSEQQFLAATRGGMPEPEAIGAGLWSLPMPMPGGSLAYTLAAVHVDAGGAVTLIDPGWDLPESFERLREFLRSIGRDVEDVRTVVVTHAHQDHLGLAAVVREVSGAAVILSAREKRSAEAFASASLDPVALLADWGVPPSVAEPLVERRRGRASHVPEVDADAVLLEDGDAIPVQGADWRVLLTPGHTAGHLCIVDAERRILFSGDHVMPTVFPGIGLGGRLETNPVADYLASLDRLEPYDDYEVVPGHGYRFRGLRRRRTEASDHIRRRAREVAAVVATEPDASTWTIASRLTWTAGWERLTRSSMLLSALAQTELYRDFVTQETGAD
ncbi:MBL fold metallo-hydrolase [Microbacterium sp. X-17]|uniref:MBL fold metallo-hydrolase n=1 Tax=Microbacterium sp. X-17 TaxID=3144404 RepID=UPI0031F5B90E